jgi:hypothetical protein
MTIELTRAEADNIIALLDLATKSGGLEVAQIALPIAVKIQLEINKEKSDGDLHDQH